MKESPGSEGFTDGLHPTFKENSDRLPKKEERTLPTHSMRLVLPVVENHLQRSLQGLGD